MENDKKILVDIHVIIKDLYSYRDTNYYKESIDYKMVTEIICFLVSTYIYKGW